MKVGTRWADERRPIVKCVKWTGRLPCGGGGGGGGGGNGGPFRTRRLAVTFFGRARGGRAALNRNFVQNRHNNEQSDWLMVQHPQYIGDCA